MNRDLVTTPTLIGGRAIAARAWALMLAVSLASAAAPLAAAVPAAGQPQPTPPMQETPAPATAAADETTRRTTAGVVRLGSDYTLQAGDAIRDVVVMGGTATLAGHVEGDVVVVLGAARLASTTVIDGDFVVVGGNVTVESGAVANRNVVVVGGVLDGPAGFGSRGDHVVIGSGQMGEGFRSFAPWVTGGLMWGRLIVPSVSWVWVVVLIMLLVYLAVSFVFATPVRAAAHVLSERPLTAFLVGLIVLVVSGPMTFLLAISIVGIAVIPFLWCALLLAALLGKVGTVCWMGTNLVAQESPDNRAQSIRSLVIGFAVVSVAYMVPVLGLATWASLSVVGLGASMLAFASGLRRENPARPALTAAPAQVPPSFQSFSQPPPQAPEAQGVAAGIADLTLFPRASFLTRLGAFVLDVLLVLIGSLALGFDNGPGRFMLLLLVYHVVLWAWKSTTVGGIICQLRVVRTDGASVQIADAVVRGLSSLFSFAVLGLGCLWILKDSERQAWHDKIAGTYIVQVPKNWPLT